MTKTTFEDARLTMDLTWLRACLRLNSEREQWSKRVNLWISLQDVLPELLEPGVISLTRITRYVQKDKPWTNGLISGV
jgi:hypothetical protein